MKLARRIAVVIFVLLLLLTSVLGCRTEKAPEDVTNGDATKGDATDYVNLTGFPVVNEPITLHIMGSLSPYHGPWEEMYVFKEMEKLTGIHVEWETYSNQAYPEKLNLVLASNELPDAFYRARLSTEQIVNYGSQGSLIPLNELIEKYASTFKKINTEFPEVKAGITAPDGNIYAIPEVNGYLAPMLNNFLWLNTEWLSSVGMEIPNTTDEFYEVLKAFKQQIPDEYGLDDIVPLGGATSRNFLPHLRGAFGVGKTSNHFEPDEDGNVFYNRIDPRYKELLEYMNKLYMEDLIDEGIFTQNNAELIAQVAQGNVGAFYYPNPSNAGVSDEDATKYEGLPLLEGPNGDIMFTNANPRIIHGTFAITSANKYPEATMRWVDYWFTEEGGYMLNGGEEGVTFNISPEGVIVFTEETKNDPQGINWALGQVTPCAGGSIPRFFLEHQDPYPKNYPNSKAARALAQPYFHEAWPNFLLTLDELGVMTSTGDDILKLSNEMDNKYIMGVEPFSTWDDYVEKVKTLGLDQVLKVQQAAYERYKGFTN